MRPEAEWAIDSEAMKVRGIIVLENPTSWSKNIDAKHLLQVIARLQSFFTAKTLQI